MRRRRPVRALLAAAVIGLVTNGLLARLLDSKQEFGAYLLAFSIISVGAVIGSLGLPKTVLRFVAEGMTRNQPGRARRAPAWRYCGRRAENIRGERGANYPAYVPLQPARPR